MIEEQAIVVSITAGTSAEAEQLAQLLVERHLAACVQILPAMTSVYRWQGSVQRETEILLLAKTLQRNFAELEQTVRENHSYKVPEIMAIRAEAVSESYFEWLSENVK